MEENERPQYDEEISEQLDINKLHLTDNKSHSNNDEVKLFWGVF